jgi:hypothetical protein
MTLFAFHATKQQAVHVRIMIENKANQQNSPHPGLEYQTVRPWMAEVNLSSLTAFGGVLHMSALHIWKIHKLLTSNCEILQ